MATNTTRVQVDLKCGNRHRTCWVEPRVKVGNEITLKNSSDPNELWEVLRVSDPIDVGSINYGWHNNI